MFEEMISKSLIQMVVEGLVPVSTPGIEYLSYLPLIESLLACLLLLSPITPINFSLIYSIWILGTVFLA